MAQQVLIVDDDPNLVRVIQFALQKAGFETTVVADGVQALAAVEQDRPAIVILDVMLPGMNGVEVCQQLRSQPETETLPIIMLSARAQVTDMVHGLEAGADEYVTKPVDLQELVARVKALLERTERLRVGGRTEEAQLRGGKVIGFVGVKGGVGTTTVALNVATVLASQKKRVIAVELVPGYGTFSVHLQQEAPQNLHHLLELEPDAIGEHELSQRLYEAPYGLRVLFGAQTVGEMAPIDGAHATAIVSGLAAMSDYTVVDLPSLPSEANRAALTLCGAVVPVVEQDPSALRSARVTLELLRTWGIARALVQPVVVYRGSLPVSPTVATIRSELRCELLGSVPEASAACAKAQDTGIPVALARPESNVAEALTEIAGRLA